MSSLLDPPRGAIRAGLVALPVYGLPVLASTLTHQPDYSSDFRAYAEYVTTPSFLVSHLAGSIAGTVIGILGLLALYGILSGNERARRAATPGLTASVAGLSLVMTLFGAAAFAQPAIGRAYLAGDQAAVAINADVYGAAAISVGVLGGLLYSLGGVFLGVAIWRFERVPRWTGLAYAVAVPLISVVGLVVGAAQTLGAVLLIAATARIAAAALHPVRSGAAVRPWPTSVS
jgi:hypothetical protein